MTRIKERIPYKEAGQKIRLSRQRLNESELRTQPRAWRVWAACIELTASYSKSAERIYVTEIAELAGMREDKVSGILYEFDKLGIFGWTKDRGRRRPGLLTLPSLTTQPRVVSEAETTQPRVSTDPASGTYLEGKEGQGGGLAPPPLENTPESLLCPSCGASDPTRYSLDVTNDDGSMTKEPMVACRECSMDEPLEVWTKHQDTARELHEARASTS